MRIRWALSPRTYSAKFGKTSKPSKSAIKFQFQKQQTAFQTVYQSLCLFEWVSDNSQQPPPPPSARVLDECIQLNSSRCHRSGGLFTFLRVFREALSLSLFQKFQHFVCHINIKYDFLSGFKCVQLMPPLLFVPLHHLSRLRVPIRNCFPLAAASADT